MTEIPSTKGMFKEAAHQHSTTHELNILVARTRVLNLVKGRSIQRLHKMLDELERQVS